MPSVSEQAIDLSLIFLTQHGVRPKFTGTRYFTRNAILTLKNLPLSDHDDLSTKLKVLEAKDVGDESALYTALRQCDEPACRYSHNPSDDAVERCYTPGGAALMGRTLSRSSWNCSPGGRRTQYLRAIFRTVDNRICKGL